MQKIELDHSSTKLQNYHVGKWSLCLQCSCQDEKNQHNWKSSYKHAFTLLWFFLYIWFHISKIQSNQYKHSLNFNDYSISLFPSPFSIKRTWLGW